MEQLPFRQNVPPLIEYPLTADGGPWERRNAGPARIVVNCSERGMPEVIYHDPTKWRCDFQRGEWTMAFSLAVYRQRVARKKRRDGKNKRKGKGKSVDRG